MQKEEKTTSIFSVCGLMKTYGHGRAKVNVLQNLDLDLTAGEMVAITGASGTGKSTLLHLLGALDRPDKGNIFYRGENIFKRDDAGLADFRNKAIGFVFQFHHLLPEFSALENTIMPGLIAGREKNELVKDAMQLLEKVGLSHRLEHRVGELSGGEQQRVALARSIIMKPALLLADEPTGNLDPQTGEMVFDLIRQMNRNFGLTIVMVTHNYGLARKMDRCLTLYRGKLIPTPLSSLVDAPLVPV